jgi:hypothetical protein
MSEGGGDQPDLLSDLSDLDIVRYFLAEMHDDLRGRVSRLRMLADFNQDLGPQGTMIFGGLVTARAWTEARSSFVNGNDVATVLLCQSLMEHLLAAYLHAALLDDDLPNRIPFRETLQRCRDRGLLSDEDVTDLRKLMGLRNPLSHFRHVDDASNPDRRAMSTRQHPEDLMHRDAVFAMRLAVRMLSKPQFRLG